MQDLSIDIKTMHKAFGGYHLLLVITCDQTNFTIAVPLTDRQTKTIAKALIYRVIYLFSPPRQIVCDEATKITSTIVQAILTMLNCRLKVISPYNHVTDVLGGIPIFPNTWQEILISHMTYDVYGYT